MNKSLLLIICDFLLISILAMVEFTPEERPEENISETIQEESKGDLLEVLQMSLDHEAEQRKFLENNLNQTNKILQTTEAEKQALSERKAALEEDTLTLNKDLSETKEVLSTVEENNQILNKALKEKESRQRQLQKELQAKLSELEKREADLQNAQNNLSVLEQKSQELETNLKIKDAEKQILEQNLTSAQTEIERARNIAQRAQAQAESLALGVNELTESSNQIRDKIADNVTLSMNRIFREFEQNKIEIRFEWTEKRLIGSSSESTIIQAIPLNTARGTFAIFHTQSTPFDSSRNDRSSSINGSAKIATKDYRIKEVSFFSPDKSIAAIQIPRSTIEANKITPLGITEDPLRFEEAILINNSGAYYGEIPLRAPPGQPNFLTVESKLFNRLFGEFSPSIGDYVISQKAELIGIMIESNRARWIKSPEFNEHQTISLP